MVLKENDIPRGHLSTLILSCLNNGDKYGYEIIGEISDKTGIVIKQPSLYSSLKRMQDQDLISSYWMDSKIGGKRHYYRLTDYGKKQSLSWYNDLLDSDTDLSRVLKNPSLLEKTEKVFSANDNDLVSDNVEITPSSKEVFLEQATLFATNDSKHNETNDKNQNQDIVTKPKQDAFIQYNLFDVRPSFTAPAEEKTDDGVFLSKDEKLPEPSITAIGLKTNNESIFKNENTINNENPATLLNKERGEQFDISSALSSLKNKINSYSGGSCSQANSYHEYVEKLQATTPKPDDDIVAPINEPIKANNSTHSQVISNDAIESPAILITESIDESVYKTKKIAPPVLDLNIAGKAGKKTTSIIDNNANTKHIPYSDIISGVYAKGSKQFAMNTEKQTNDKVEKGSLITNYQTLASGLNARGVSLWQYNKNDDQRTTNKTYINSYKFSMVFYSMCIVMLVLSSVIPFLILSRTSYIQQNQLWLYVAPPCVFAFFALVSLIIKHRNKYKKINVREVSHINAYIKVAFSILFMLIVYAINVNYGLTAGNFNDYTTTIILPCVYALNIPLSSVLVYFSKKVRYIY